MNSLPGAVVSQIVDCLRDAADIAACGGASRSLHRASLCAAGLQNIVATLDVGDANAHHSFARWLEKRVQHVESIVLACDLDMWQRAWRFRSFRACSTKLRQAAFRNLGAFATLHSPEDILPTTLPLGLDKLVISSTVFTLGYGFSRLNCRELVLEGSSIRVLPGALDTPFLLSLKVRASLAYKDLETSFAQLGRIGMLERVELWSDNVAYLPLLTGVKHATLYRKATGGHTSGHTAFRFPRGMRSMAKLQTLRVFGDSTTPTTWRGWNNLPSTLAHLIVHCTAVFGLDEVPVMHDMESALFVDTALSAATATAIATRLRPATLFVATTEAVAAHKGVPMQKLTGFGCSVEHDDDMTMCLPPATKVLFTTTALIGRFVGAQVGVRHMYLDGPALPTKATFPALARLEIGCPAVDVDVGAFLRELKKIAPSNVAVCFTDSGHDF